MATSKSSSSEPANKLVSIQKALHDFLHTPSVATPLFELVEKNAKIKREYLFLGEFPPSSLPPYPGPVECSLSSTSVAAYGNNTQGGPPALLSG